MRYNVESVVLCTNKPTTNSGGNIMRKKTIALIVGGSRGIGFEMALQYLLRYTEVVVLSSSGDRGHLPENIHYYKCNILNEKEVDTTIEMLHTRYREFEIVTMAVGGVCRSAEEEYALNCIAPMDFIKKLLKQCDVIKTLTFISSLSVCFYQDERFRPKGYAYAKKEGEEILRKLAEKFRNTAFIIYRPGYVKTQLLRGLKGVFFPEDVVKISVAMVQLGHKKAQKDKVALIYPSWFPWILSRFESWPRWMIKIVDRWLIMSFYHFYKSYLTKR